MKFEEYKQMLYGARSIDEMDNILEYAFFDNMITTEEYCTLLELEQEYELDF